MSIFNTSRLLGKTVLTTGASEGIGAVCLPALSTIESSTNPLTSHTRCPLCALPCLPGYRHIIRKGTNPPLSISVQPFMGCTGSSNLILLVRRGDQLKIVAEATRAVHQASGVQQGGSIVTIQLNVLDKAQIAALWSKAPPALCNVNILSLCSCFVLCP